MLLYLYNQLCEIHIAKTLYIPSLHKSYNICSIVVVGIYVLVHFY